MNRYVLKINDSTYVSEIDWIMFEIPHQLKTSDLQNAMIVTDEYLNHGATKSGFGMDVTVKELILQHHPHIKIVKIKLIEDE